MMQTRLSLIRRKQRNSRMETFFCIGCEFNSCKTYHSSFFTLLIRRKWSNIVRIQTGNFEANSRVVWDVSLSTIAFSSSLFTLGWGFPRGSFSRLKSPERNFTNQNDTVLWPDKPSPNLLLILRAFSDTLVPQQNEPR